MQDYLKIALGVLKLTPRDFYSMTICEFELALEGYQMSNGIKKKELMSRNEFLDLMGK